MSSYPERPTFGFVILSNGEVLRGTNPYSYDEDEIARYYAQWIVMKKQGVFDDQPVNATTPSSSAAQISKPNMKMMEDPNNNHAQDSHDGKKFKMGHKGKTKNKKGQ